MRLLLDADTPIQMLSLLQYVLPKHQVDHVHGRGWSAKKDIPLLRDAAAAGYDVFVTNDWNQLDDPAETDAIKKSRMHHVRYNQRRGGLQGLALAIGAVVAAMPAVVEFLEDADGQRLVHSDVELLRYLLVQEIRMRAASWGIADSLRLVALPLSECGRAEDVWLPWEAKCTNFDTYTGLDGTLLYPAGAVGTLAYRRTAEHTDREKLLEYRPGLWATSRRPSKNCTIASLASATITGVDCACHQGALEMISPRRRFAGKSESGGRSA
jgi:hypothetical protein